MESDNQYWKIAANILVGSATAVVGIGLLGQNVIERLIGLKNSIKSWVMMDDKVDMTPMVIMEKEDEKITIQDKQDTYVYQTPLRPNL